MAGEFSSKLYEEIVPWLFEKTNEFLIDEEIHEKNTDKLLEDVMKIEKFGHRYMIEKEHKRQEDERVRAEEAYQQKLNDKEQRKLEREHNRKEEELRKLKEDINEKFIESGECVEGITSQEISTPDSDMMSKNIIGAVGGPFVQIAVVLSALKNREEEEFDDFYTKKNIAQFLIFYVILNMKPEEFTVQMGRHVEDFMKENNDTMEEITQLTGNKAKEFRELMKDRQNGMLNANFRYIDSIAKEIGLNSEVYQMVHDVLADIITRKPKAKPGVETKQDQFLKKIKVTTVPEDSPEENEN